MPIRPDFLLEKEIPELETRIRTMKLFGKHFDLNLIRSTFEILSNTYSPGMLEIVFLHNTQRRNLWINPDHPFDSNYKRLLIFIVDTYEPLFQLFLRRGDKSPEFISRISLEYSILSKVPQSILRTKASRTFECFTRPQAVIDIDPSFKEHNVYDFFLGLCDEFGRDSVEWRDSGNGFHMVIYLSHRHWKDSQSHIQRWLRSLRKKSSLKLDLGCLEPTRLISFPGSPVVRSNNPSQWSTVTLMSRPSNTVLSDSFLSEKRKEQLRGLDNTTGPVIRRSEGKIDPVWCLKDIPEVDIWLLGEFVFGSTGYSYITPVISEETCFGLVQRLVCSKRSWIPARKKRFKKQELEFETLLKSFLAASVAIEKGMISYHGGLSLLFNSIGEQTQLVVVWTSKRKYVEKFGKHTFWFEAYDGKGYYGYRWLAWRIAKADIDQFQRRFRRFSRIRVLNQFEGDPIPVPLSPLSSGRSFSRYVGKGEIHPPLTTSFKDNLGRFVDDFFGSLFADELKSFDFPFWNDLSKPATKPKQKPAGKAKRKQIKKSSDSTDPIVEHLDEISLLVRGLPVAGSRQEDLLFASRSLARLGYSRFSAKQIIRQRLEPLENKSDLYQVSPNKFWEDVNRVIDKCKMFDNKKLCHTENGPPLRIRWTLESYEALLAMMDYDSRLVKAAKWVFDHAAKQRTFYAFTLDIKICRKQMPKSQCNRLDGKGVYTPSAIIDLMIKKGLLKRLLAGVPKKFYSRYACRVSFVGGTGISDDDEALARLSPLTLARVNGLSESEKERISKLRKHLPEAIFIRDPLPPELRVKPTPLGTSSRSNWDHAVERSP